MLSLTDRDAVTAALTDKTLDPSLRALLGLRAWQLDDARDRPLGDIVQFVVVQPGDKPDAIHKAVGFPITWDQAEQPGIEWMEDHGAWFELTYVLTDDFGMIVFVADHPDTEFGLRFNCLAMADRSSKKGTRREHLQAPRKTAKPRGSRPTTKRPPPSRRL